MKTTCSGDWEVAQAAVGCLLCAGNAALIHIHSLVNAGSGGGGMQKLASTKQSGESSSSSDGAGGDQGQQMGSMLLVGLPCLC